MKITSKIIFETGIRRNNLHATRLHAKKTQQQQYFIVTFNAKGAIQSLCCMSIFSM